MAHKLTWFIDEEGDLIDDFYGEDIRPHYRVGQEIMIKSVRYNILAINHKGNRIEFTVKPK